MWSLVALDPFSKCMLKLELFNDAQDSWYGTVQLWCSPQMLPVFFKILGEISLTVISFQSDFMKS
jgi:hypothetical protein